MDCPACKEAMIVLESDRIEIDHCISCKGVWLDSGELELLLDDPSESDQNNTPSERRNDLFSSFKVNRESKEPARKCPICSKKMEKVLCGREDEVTIDRCREGDGIWFDLGELERIVKLGSFGGSTKVLDWLKDIFRSRV